MLCNHSRVSRLVSRVPGLLPAVGLRDDRDGFSGQRGAYILVRWSFTPHEPGGERQTIGEGQGPQGIRERFGVKCVGFCVAHIAECGFQAGILREFDTAYESRRGSSKEGEVWSWGGVVN